MNSLKVLVNEHGSGMNKLIAQINSNADSAVKHSSADSTNKQIAPKVQNHHPKIHIGAV
jgi:hypothetical protein